MRIDAHAHLIPSAYRAELERRGFASYPLPPWSPEIAHEFMAAYAIDAAVWSISPPGVFFGDVGLARELARMCNEATADLVRSEPTRFAGLATLPLPDLDSALSELAFALDELRLDGIALLSNVGGTYLGEPRWDPLFAELNRRRAYVFVHPIEPATPSPMPSIPVWVQEFPFDTTRAAVSLVYSGTLERHQQIRLQLAHLGGAVPFLAHRIAELAVRDPDWDRAAPAGALAYLARLFYDTGLSNNAPAVAAVREMAPLDHIVFGTDWPYAALPPGRDPAPGLRGLDPVEREWIEGTNAYSLIPRLAMRPPA